MRGQAWWDLLRKLRKPVTDWGVVFHHRCLRCILHIWSPVLLHLDKRCGVCFAVAMTTAEGPNSKLASRQDQRETTGKNGKAALKGIGDRLKKKRVEMASCACVGCWMSTGDSKSLITSPCTLSRHLASQKRLAGTEACRSATPAARNC